MVSEELKELVEERIAEAARPFFNKPITPQTQHELKQTLVGVMRKLEEEGVVVRLHQEEDFAFDITAVQEENKIVIAPGNQFTKDFFNP